MIHFIAKSDSRKPSAAQAAKIRKALLAIDENLYLVIDGGHGAAACWVAGPDYYGASHYADRKTAAAAAFHNAMQSDAGPSK